MWLSERLSRRNDAAAADFGAVINGGEYADVLAHGEWRTIPAAAPGGYGWIPDGGEEVFLLRGENGEICVAGSLQKTPPVSLEAGEICLYSAGGAATIVLRRDGKIEINGTLTVNGVPLE